MQLPETKKHLLLLLKELSVLSPENLTILGSQESVTVVGDASLIHLGLKSIDLTKRSTILLNTGNLAFNEGKLITKLLLAASDGILG